MAGKNATESSLSQGSLNEDETVTEKAQGPGEQHKPRKRKRINDAAVFDEALRKLQENMYQQLRSNR